MAGDATRKFWAVVCGFAVLLTAGALTAQEAPTDTAVSQQTQKINEQVAAGWKEHGIKPSGLATDGEWCRRVFLDVIGRIPTTGELDEFLKSRDKQKRDKLVQKLIFDEEYTEEYARNWTTLWTNILIGRSGGTERRTLINRGGMQKYLRDSFARNKPYDQMVHELITAKGTTKPGADTFNGAVNFLIMKVNEEKASLATAASARIFMGVQVQCTQCHNHPFNSWKQRKFWEFNSFLRQTRALRRYKSGTRDVEFAELVDEDFGGEGGSPEEAEIYFELRNGLLKAAYPVFLDGTEIGRSGFVEDVNRRDELGKLIVQSSYMPRALVNRMWAHFLGYGFTKPIDDMGPHTSPTHPELLDYLAEEFQRHSFDLKIMMQWIVLSKPYALSSRTNSTNVAIDDPLMGESPKFSRFYLRQMRAEELYESLIVATEADRSQGNYAAQEKVKSEWLGQFVIAFGNDEGTEMTTFNGTIPQVLMMFNGGLIKKAMDTKSAGVLGKVIASREPIKKQIEYLYLAGMSRKPSRDELGWSAQLIRYHKGDTNKALQDVWWSILNSNEFIFNH